MNHRETEAAVDSAMPSYQCHVHKRFNSKKMILKIPKKSSGGRAWIMDGAISNSEHRVCIHLRSNFVAKKTPKNTRKKNSSRSYECRDDIQTSYTFQVKRKISIISRTIIAFLRHVVPTFDYGFDFVFVL